ncbi:MAG: hypothetical protein ACLTZN_07215 [Streptococcus sp.]
MAVIQKTNELESMMASLQLSLILKRRELILRRTNVFKKIRRNKFMAIFHQLPDSVLQLLAVFLSIIIEACPLFCWEVSYLALSKSL